MSNELNGALKTFINEALELLEDVEQTLLDCDHLDASTTDLLFRNIHTIKGSAGLFGLTELVALAHKVESLLDRIRTNQLEGNPELIDLLIESGDQLKKQVLDLQDGESNLISSHSEVNALIDKLDTWLPEEPDPISKPAPKKHIEGNVLSGVWHISFRPLETVFKDGLDPISFINYLSNLGEVVEARMVLDELDKNLEQFDPEVCYLGFEIRFRGAVTRNQLMEVFEFIQNDAQIILIPPNSQIEQYLELIRRLPEADHKIGEILLQVGAITEQELNSGLKSQKKVAEATNRQPLLGQVMQQEQKLPEEVLNAALKKQQPAIKPAKTLRVEADKLDRLIDLVGEMVITGARTSLLAHETGSEPLTEAMAQLERLVESIRDSSLQLRMVQIGDTFNKYKRVVKDTSAELGKQVELVVSGAETELDKTFVEKLSDPLTHLVRNAIDHGIESHEERVINGKPATGMIRLNAFHDSGSIVIEVIDDGRGIDEEKVLKRATEKGLIAAKSSLSARDIRQLIFEPGFSTRDEVTDLSGRGVGMDVVKRNIEMLRGNIELETRAGQGSRVSIRLPLTLSIIDGFMFQVGDGDYVIPLDNVVECLELQEIADPESLQKQFVNLREEVLPFVRLSEWFGIEATSSFEEEALIVVQFGSFRAGLVVDALKGEFQTVVKPLGPLFEGLKGVSGATILGSGDVAVILDIFALIQTALNQNDRINVERFNQS
ncbi:chemotaxis protein CheA [Vibrio sonorensis]|uniref:chemotaxis protein CheA n=1 Tax=Vibrio sonorensis TaxID=1004316 RepID=UPI0008DA0E9F|nr:chemotaxis protein CheA [Vibrio sonorensis]